MLIAAGQTWGDYSVRMRRMGGALGNSALRAAGTPEQQGKWGHLTLAMAITEPGCGSDPSLVRTTAVLDGDEWVLNGEKIFVTTGCLADGAVIWATIDPTAGRAGIKSFLVEKGTPGFIVAHKEKKLGIRADDTAAYVFQDCRIPRANLLGGNEGIPRESSGGFRDVMKTFNMTRPGVAAIGLGMSQAALDFTRDQLALAGVRIEYGPALPAQSALAQKFLELEALQDAAMLTVLRAAWLSDRGLPNNLEASICKAKAGTAVRRITQGCIEILGPLGISREQLLEKWFRDVRITDIYEGTGQIQRLIIARTILGYSRAELR
jgi:acyl-CoA dehydrogenase